MENLNDCLTICSVMYNEADRIASFISAAQNISTNIVVVVQESTDNTLEILSDIGIKVIRDTCHGHPEASFHFFLDHINTQWAAIIDADESIEADISQLYSLLCSSSSPGLSLQRKTKIKTCNYLATTTIELEDDYHLRIFRPNEVDLPCAIHTRIVAKDGGQPARIPEQVAILKHEKSIFEQIKDDLNYMKIMNGKWTSRAQLELNNALIAMTETFHGSYSSDCHTSVWGNDPDSFIKGIELCRINPLALTCQDRFGSSVASLDLIAFERTSSAIVRYPIFSLPNYSHHPFAELFDRYAVANNWHLFVEPASIALDIGGHVGDTSLVLASLVEASGACIAFEPNPSLIPALRQTAMLNHGNLDIYPVCAAVSDTHLGVSTFADHGNSNINGGLDLTHLSATSNWTKELFSNIPNQMRYDVPTIKLIPFLDDFLRVHKSLKDKPISFVKIDVEGFEAYILESNSEFFEAYQPVIFLEWFQYHDSQDTKRLFDLLHSLGYSPLNPATLLPVSPESDWIPDLLCIPPRLSSLCISLSGFRSFAEYSIIASKIDLIKKKFSNHG